MMALTKAQIDALKRQMDADARAYSLADAAAGRSRKALDTAQSTYSRDLTAAQAAAVKAAASKKAYEDAIKPPAPPPAPIPPAPVPQPVPTPTPTPPAPPPPGPPSATDWKTFPTQLLKTQRLDVDFIRDGLVKNFQANGGPLLTRQYNNRDAVNGWMSLVGWGDITMVNFSDPWSVPGMPNPFRETPDGLYIDMLEFTPEMKAKFWPTAPAWSGWLSKAYLTGTLWTQHSDGASTEDRARHPDYWKWEKTRRAGPAGFEFHRGTALKCMMKMAGIKGMWPAWVGYTHFGDDGLGEIDMAEGFIGVVQQNLHQWPKTSTSPPLGPWIAKDVYLPIEAADGGLVVDPHDRWVEFGFTWGRDDIMRFYRDNRLHGTVDVKGLPAFTCGDMFHLQICNAAHSGMYWDVGPLVKADLPKASLGVRYLRAWDLDA